MSYFKHHLHSHHFHHCNQLCHHRSSIQECRTHHYTKRYHNHMLQFRNRINTTFWPPYLKIISCSHFYIHYSNRIAYDVQLLYNRSNVKIKAVQVQARQVKTLSALTFHRNTVQFLVFVIIYKQKTKICHCSLYFQIFSVRNNVTITEAECQLASTDVKRPA